LNDLIEISKPLRIGIESHLTSTKLTLGHLITLLASADGIPEMHLPVVDFPSFRVNDSECLTVVKHLKDATIQSSNWRLAIASASSTILNLMSAYSKGGQFERFEIQISQLHEFVMKGMEAFDRERNCMKDEFDGASFSDFFMHPQSMFNVIMSHFLADENHNSIGFKRFVEVVINQYNLMQWQKAVVVNAMITRLFGIGFAPKLRFDGKGTLEKGELELGLELISNDDPIRLLAIIGDIDVDADADVEKGVREAVRKADLALECLTLSGKSLLRFAFEFTTPKYLTEKEVAVRTALGEFLGIS
jgi:hypothetical protein